VLLRALAASSSVPVAEGVGALRARLASSEGFDAIELAALLAARGDDAGARVLRELPATSASRIEVFFAKAGLFLLDLPIDDALREARSVFRWRDALVEECAFPAPRGPSIERAVLGAWEVLCHGVDGAFLGLLILREEAYAFFAADGVEVPAHYAERCVFIEKDVGRARITPARGLTLEQDLATVRTEPGRLPRIATVNFVDQPGEDEYAIVLHADGTLGFSPMFHVAFGINEPPRVRRGR
jgi:hypothetical protein